MEANCLICRRLFITYPSKIKIGKGKYCSRKCSLKITSIQPNKATQFKKGQKPHNFKGWRYCGGNKRYRELYLPDHPCSNKNGYYKEHRFIMEKHLGRFLLFEEEIHHIDKNGLNNKLDNLRLIKNKSVHLSLEHKLGTYKNHLDQLHDL